MYSLNIQLIRFIGLNEILDIFGEKFPVDKNLVYNNGKVSVLSKNKDKIIFQNNLVDEINCELSG